MLCVQHFFKTVQNVQILTGLWLGAQLKLEDVICAAVLVGHRQGVGLSGLLRLQVGDRQWNGVLSGGLAGLDASGLVLAVSAGLAELDGGLDGGDVPLSGGGHGVGLEGEGDGVGLVLLEAVELLGLGLLDGLDCKIKEIVSYLRRNWAKFNFNLQKSSRFFSILFSMRSFWASVYPAWMISHLRAFPLCLASA